MLQREFRLPSSVRFRTASTYGNPYFTVKIMRNDKNISRFGFLVSKKVDKRAVVRNRVKRQIRSRIEVFLQELHTGFDVLFIIKQAAVNQETSVLSDEVGKILIKAGLVTSENKV